MSVQWAGGNPRTEQLLLIFDGHCGVCSRFVEWATARDKSQRIRFVPCQLADVRALGIERADCERQAIAIGQGRTRYRGAGAVNAVLRELPQPWHSIAALSRIRG